VTRQKENRPLPEFCECGGRMLYEHDFGMVFSCCDKCTPVVVMQAPPLPGEEGKP
jgi:hypothetical protein